LCRRPGVAFRFGHVFAFGLVRRVALYFDSYGIVPALVLYQPFFQAGAAIYDIRQFCRVFDYRIYFAGAARYFFAFRERGAYDFASA